MFKDEYGKNRMTLQQATLPLPQFDQIQLADLKK
jgi:oligopeptidase A